MVKLAVIAQRHPAQVAGGGARHEVQHAQVAPQDPVLSMGDQGIENAVTAEELARVLFHPHPRAHFKCQGQEGVIGLQRARL